MDLSFFFVADNRVEIKLAAMVACLGYETDPEVRNCGRGKRVKCGTFVTGIYFSLIIHKENIMLTVFTVLG